MKYLIFQKIKQTIITIKQKKENILRAKSQRIKKQSIPIIFILFQFNIGPIKK